MINAPSAAPGIEPMPPTITTTSDASRKRVSSPGEIDWNVPPTTPAMPASPAPSANTSTNTSWIRTPVAARMSRSSTPARAGGGAEARAAGPAAPTPPPARGPVAPQPHRDADHDRGGEDHQPHHG